MSACYLELKEAALQRLLVHHPLIVLLGLHDACIHVTEQGEISQQVLELC